MNFSVKKNCEQFDDLFGDIFSKSPNLLKKKRDKICELLSEKKDPFGVFLVISFVDHFLVSLFFNFQFNSKKSVKVLLQYLISSI